MQWFAWKRGQNDAAPEPRDDAAALKYGPRHCEERARRVAPLVQPCGSRGQTSTAARLPDHRDAQPADGLLRGVGPQGSSASKTPRTTSRGRSRSRVLPALADLIKRQRELTIATEQARGIIVRHVFHRQGKPVKSFRAAWQTACAAAGVPNRIPHDFRRTAARNRSRAGVPDQVIMSLRGWKTRSAFDRYRIVNETDLADGLAKLAGTCAVPEPASPGNVVTMPRARAAQ